MELSEVMDRWFGHAKEPPLRALFLGAGFTKACWKEAPTFAELVPEAGRRAEEILANADPLVAKALGHAIREKHSDPAGVFEALVHAGGKSAALQVVLAEPHGDGGLRLAPPLSAVHHPLPPDAPSMARTLQGWRECIRARLFGLPQLSPRGGVVALGRLIAERAVDHVLSTNWDAYVELACMLAGLQVVDEHDRHKGEAELVGPATPCGKLRVFEGAADVAQRERPQDNVLLLKLHGGIRSLSLIEADLASGHLDADQAERLLQRSFLVASTDLAMWKGAADWVEAQVRDTLSGRSTLFLGVSFEDGATFLAVRRMIEAWEESARTDAACSELGRNPRSVNWQPETLEGPRVAAVDYAPRLRALNALTISVPRPRGTPASRVLPLAKDDAQRAIRVALAHHLLASIRRELELAPLGGCGTSEETTSTAKLTELMASLHNSERLVSLVVDAFAPSARWAAICEGVPPFVAPHSRGGLNKLSLHDPEASWWYAPWTVQEKGASLEPAQLSIVVDALWWAYRGGWKVASEGEWIEWKRHTVWLWPWPWRWREGLMSTPLHEALAGPFALRIPPMGRPVPGLIVVPLMAEGTHNWVDHLLVGGSLCEVWSWRELIRHFGEPEQGRAS